MTSPTGFPRGWFVVAWSDDLTAAEVKPMRYFGQDLVLFRDALGEPAILDAYCPHLGAHLGHGGEVVDGTVKCPFHAWRFDGTGRCVDIPYKKSKIPKQAKVRAWTTIEKNGAIFVWHGADGGAPDWQVPPIECVGDSGWTPWSKNQVQIATHPREIVENVADKAHFPTVHRTHVSVFENFYDDHRATQHTVGVATPPKGGEDRFDITATYHGPAFQISDMKGYLHATLFLAHTPIEENLLDLRFAVALERSGPKTDDFSKLYVENLTLGFHEDIAIWEHKVFRDKPRLCDGDGPLGRLRLWYKQFYRPVSA